MRSPRPPKPRQSIPPAFKVQFGRLFGGQTVFNRNDDMTEAEWKRVLHNILRELEQYLKYNVDTDELHMYMIYTGFLAAEKALNERDFWPPYCEAILRISFLLMGDYPDHRRRQGGRKQEGFYSLQRFRTLRYVQETNQKLSTLLAVTRFGLPKLEKDPREALHEFRGQMGFKATYKDFFKWYRKNHPKDYALVF